MSMEGWTMNNRKPLHNRRQVETVTFRFNGQTYHGSVGLYPDHTTPGEVWLEAGHIGSDVQLSAKEAAVAASLALQHGCSVDTLRGALPKLSNGKPASALGTFLSLVND
jgi:hypothetical protein